MHSILFGSCPMVGNNYSLKTHTCCPCKGKAMYRSVTVQTAASPRDNVNKKCDLCTVVYCFCPESFANLSTPSDHSSILKALPHSRPLSSRVPNNITNKVLPFLPLFSFKKKCAPGPGWNQRSAVDLMFNHKHIKIATTRP